MKIDNKPFLWLFFENTTNKNVLDITYDEGYDMNMILDSGKKTCLAVSDNVFRKTFTKTMLKRETDDDDE